MNSKLYRTQAPVWIWLQKWIILTEENADIGYYPIIREMEELEECSVSPPDPTIQFVLEQVNIFNYIHHLWTA